MAKQEKFNHKKFFSALCLPSPHHCALYICIMRKPNLPIGRDTCSTINSSVLPAPTRGLLKR